MSSTVPRVTIVGDGDGGEIFASSSCTLIESENLRFRKMEFADVEPLLSLFNEAVNYQAYGTTGPKEISAVSGMVERDISRPFYTGYLILAKATGEVLGRGAIGSGYLPKNDLDVEGAYKAAALDKSSGIGPAELQIGDFLASEPAKVGPTGKSRPELYQEMILTLLVAANNFIQVGELQNGQRVKRVTITVINPEKSGFSGVARDDLEMRKAVIETIFGKPAGVLLPQSSDPRNYSEHQRDVYACEASGLEALLLKNDYA